MTVEPVLIILSLAEIVVNTKFSASLQIPNLLKREVPIGLSAKGCNVFACFLVVPGARTLLLCIDVLLTQISYQVL